MKDLAAALRALSPGDCYAVLLWLASSTEHRGALEAALQAMGPYLGAPEGNQP